MPADVVTITGEVLKKQNSVSGKITGELVVASPQRKIADDSHHKKRNASHFKRNVTLHFEKENPFDAVRTHGNLVGPDRSLTGYFRNQSTFVVTEFALG